MFFSFYEFQKIEKKFAQPVALEGEVWYFLLQNIYIYI